MTEFKKYLEIENSYHAKNIQRFLAKFPELMFETYVIQEKLHGCNICLIFTPNEGMLVCSRNKILDPDESFFDVWNTLKKYEEELRAIQQYVDTTKTIMRVFGELVGSGINKGVDYMDEKFIRFFDIYIDDKLIAPIHSMTLLDNIGVTHMIVPIIGIVPSLQEALSFSCEFPTKINPKEGNICEGIVIKSYHNVFISPVGEVFYLKKKNEKFKEKQHEPKPIMELDEFDNWNNVFRTYITHNRVESTYSKMGIISENKQLVEYIKVILDDARKDFLKDYGEELKGASKAQLKRVFNIGSTLASMLMEDLC